MDFTVLTRVLPVGRQAQGARPVVSGKPDAADRKYFREHHRILHDAAGTLIYTSLTVGQVADSLGVVEQAYFSRFFKRTTDLTLKAFRLQRREI